MSALPFLPGYTFSDPHKKTHARPQQFNYRNGVPVQDGRAKPATTYKVPLPPGVGPSWKTVSGEAPPTWLAFEKKALKFEAYFEENIPNSKEQNRVRKCNIYYYLEDGTVMIEEPKVENSGLPQGVIVQRHRAQKGNGEVFKWDDFNLDIDINLFGITYHVTDCDSYTQDFYMKAGFQLNESKRPPSDPYEVYRTQMIEAMRPVRQGKTGPDPLRRFLDNDGKVLRFYCLWEDKTSARGELRNFVLLYFLADDTLQVNEALPPNSGRDPFPVFAKRQTPPKDFAGLEALEIGKTVTIFNRKLTIYTVDLFTQEYYREHFGINDFTPLKIQQEERVLPTRISLRTKMPINMAPPLLASKVVVANGPPGFIFGRIGQENSKEIPKYNGFGTEEDSLVSCLSLVPKPPKKDFQKLIENDKKILQFAARLISKKPDDQPREFVVTYFLADDTISIFEPHRSGSAYGGKFLERRKLKKPTESPLPFAAYSRTIQQVQRPTTAPLETSPSYNSRYSPTLRPSTTTESTRNTTANLSPIRGRTSPSPYSPPRVESYSRTASTLSPGFGRTSPSPPTSPGGLPGIDGEYYVASDMYVGAVIEASKHKFTLTDASKFAFEYMEANPAQFPYAHVGHALSTVKTAIANNQSLVGDLFSEKDPEGRGVVPLDAFKQVMQQVCTDITDHEIVTVGRKYDKNKDKTVAYADLYKEAVAETDN